MAAPEEIIPIPASQPPELSLIPGGLAVDRIVEVIPVPVLSFEAFAQTIPTEEEWADKSAEELLAVRESISQYMSQMASHIHELTQDHDAAIRKLIYINGFIRDRQ